MVPAVAVLADTHALIWYLTDPEMLSPTAVHVLDGGAEPSRRIVVSAVSLIELVYVAEKRSDSIDGDTRRELCDVLVAPDSPFVLAPVTVDVANRMALIDRRHVRDPFDRAIIATAQASGLRLVTKDGLLTEHFPDLCLW
ncbi:MAG: type II toxin-antitoxin system VapC family toxin [Pseudonocardiaceae bacterium]